MGGGVVERGRGAALDDAAGIHDVNPVRITGDNAEIVGDDDQRDPEPLGQLLH